MHHSGRSDDERTRGHSSLDGNPDFQWLVKKSQIQGGMVSRVTLAKMKDGNRTIAFDVHLAVTELGLDEDGDPITTLVVDDITEASAEGYAEGIKEAQLSCPLKVDPSLRYQTEHLRWLESGIRKRTA